MSRPIVFLTDYGLADEFVGICHGVMAKIAPEARVIDLTHSIARQQVLQGALVLARATTYMPADAVYVAVVDPDVGSARRAIAVEAASGALLVGPDNGLLSMAWRALGGATRAFEIASGKIVLPTVSKTFHGRDIFAPAAAHLASGTPVEEVGPEVPAAELQAVDLPGPMIAPGKVGARVMGVDGFGNVQLNVHPGDLERAGLGGRLTVAGRSAPRVSTFSDLHPNALGAIVDSQGFIALVLNQGSAAELLGLRPGATVVIE
ncbi:MAG: SAM-dependent chlorinase/fluorinase [Actinobacteria bacterium]|nr:SAM-dependent chlorinase/fluorinase [Actinomycetota bacterium]